MTPLLIVLGLLMALPYALIVALVVLGLCRSAHDVHEQADRAAAPLPADFFDRDRDVPFDTSLEAYPFTLPGRQAGR